MFNVSTPMLVLRSREGDFLSARGRIFFLVWERHLHLISTMQRYEIFVIYININC